MCFENERVLLLVIYISVVFKFGQMQTHQQKQEQQKSKGPQSLSLSLKESALVTGCKKWREVDCKIVATLGRIKARTEHFLNHFSNIIDVLKQSSTSGHCIIMNNAFINHLLLAFLFRVKSANVFALFIVAFPQSF